MILNALDEILFWEDIEVLRREIRSLHSQYYPHDFKKYYEKKEEFLRNYIPSREAFIKRLQHYAEHGSPIWVSSRNPCCDDLSCSALCKINSKNTWEHGQTLANRAHTILDNDPTFWKRYANLILPRQQNFILELTIGAGLGTTAIMQNMSERDLYVGVDIDLSCVKNADALAKYHEIHGFGVTTSLWNLPFDDNVFSAVFSNVGLEECREIPQILYEASRVLAPGGRLVLHNIEPQKSLWLSYFSLYGVSEQEAEEWLKAIRLYAGTQQIINLCAELNLTLINCVHDENGKGYLLTFEK